jgi:hypothetical protein
MLTSFDRERHKGVVLGRDHVEETSPTMALLFVLCMRDRLSFAEEMAQNLELQFVW